MLRNLGKSAHVRVKQLCEKGGVVLNCLHLNNLSRLLPYAVLKAQSGITPSEARLNCIGCFLPLHLARNLATLMRPSGHRIPSQWIARDAVASCTCPPQDPRLPVAGGVFAPCVSQIISGCFVALPSELHTGNQYTTDIKSSGLNGLPAALRNACCAPHGKVHRRL